MTDTEEMLIKLITSRRGGIEYLLNDKLCFSLACQTEMTNEDINTILNNAT